MTMRVCEFCGGGAGATGKGQLKGDAEYGYYHTPCLDAAWASEYGGMTDYEVAVAEGLIDGADRPDPATGRRALRLRLLA